MCQFWVIFDQFARHVIRVFFTEVIYCWVNSLILCFYLCVIDVWIHAETADSCKYNLTIRHSFCKLVKFYCTDNYTYTPISYPSPLIRAWRTVAGIWPEDDKISRTVWKSDNYPLGNYKFWSNDFCVTLNLNVTLITW